MCRVYGTRDTRLGHLRSTDFDAISFRAPAQNKLMNIDHLVQLFCALDREITMANTTFHISAERKDWIPLIYHCLQHQTSPVLPFHTGLMTEVREQSPTLPQIFTGLMTQC